MIKSKRLMHSMNDTEIKQHTRTGAVSSFGKSYTFITCPFCGEETKAFLWSLAGSGKKCTCGVIHTGYGTTIKKTK